MIRRDGQGILHGLEFTALLNEGKVFHYTCNAPPLEVLKKYGVEAIGNTLNPEDSEGRGVLKIPVKLYKKFGYVVTPGRSLQAVSEHLLRRLEERISRP